MKINAKDNDSFVIRRAYIDVLGIVPTIEELEWYLVYNNNGYELAVDWLIKRNSDTLYTKEYLLSSNYRKQPKEKIDKYQVHKNLLYVTGSNIEITTENIKIASLKLIKNAISSRETESDIIDYMCESMMGRSSNLVESDKLSKIIRNTNKEEMDAWLDVLNEILELDDVNSK